jgi:hypothetical protein
MIDARRDLDAIGALGVRALFLLLSPFLLSSSFSVPVFLSPLLSLSSSSAGPRSLIM